MFESALKEFEANLAEIELALEIYEDSAWLRPRLSRVLQWTALDQESIRRLNAFFKRDGEQIDVAFRGLYVATAACVEQVLRRLIKDAITAIVRKKPIKADLNEPLVMRHLCYSGRALSAIFEPSDHLDIDYAALCHDVGTCANADAYVAINAAVFSAITIRFSAEDIDKALARFGFKLNWDEVARDQQLKTLVGVAEKGATRKAANAIADYLREFGRIRNRSAHNGAGGKSVGAEDVRKAVSFSRAFMRRLSELTAEYCGSIT